VPRGLAFHLPPSTMEMLLIFSWTLSPLAGNENGVRLPSVRSAKLEWSFNMLLEILSDHGDAYRYVLCSYGRDTSLHREISLRSRLSVIWSGDAKVREVSVQPVRSDGLTPVFRLESPSVLSTLRSTPDLIYQHGTASREVFLTISRGRPDGTWLSPCLGVDR
jgi:hypothetical protein